MEDKVRFPFRFMEKVMNDISENGFRTNEWNFTTDGGNVIQITTFHTSEGKPVFEVEINPGNKD